MKSLLRVFRGTGINSAEFKLEDSIGIGTRGGVGPNVELSKQGIKSFLVLQAIVVAQHGNKQRLAKSTRSQEKEIGRRFIFQLFNIARLVHISIPIFNQTGKIADPIRQFHPFSPKNCLNLPQSITVYLFPQS